MGGDKPSRDDRPQLSEANREEWMQGLTEAERQAADASRKELRGVLRQMAAGELEPTVVDGEAESVSLLLNAEEAVTVELDDEAASATLIAREKPEQEPADDGEPAQGAEETG